MNKHRRRIAPLLPLLLSALLLAACSSINGGSTPTLEAVSPQYIGAASVPKQAVKVGDSLEMTVEKLDVGQFPWGKSRFFAMQLPADSHPYYLVVKSYFVSPVTHMKYGEAKTGSFWEPGVFFPYVVFLGKNMNIISHSRTEDFQVNANIHTEILIGFRGDTWLQAAFPITFPEGRKPEYAVISTSSDYVGKVGAVPNFFWPYRDRFWLQRIIYAPRLSPVPTYQGPMNTLRYGNVGEIQVQLVRPQELLQTTYGRKLDNPTPSRTLSPKTVFQKENLVVQSPNADGYGVEDISSQKNVNMVFTKSLGAGQGYISMFVQAFHSNNQNVKADIRAQAMADAAIKEHSTALINFSARTKAFGGLTGHCKRIDFEARQPRAFLADINGYDIVCADENSDLGIRIGASILTSPAAPTTKLLPSEADDFAYGISIAE